ncbi:MAG: ABC transporter permease [Myxococcota bacterium]
MSPVTAQALRREAVTTAIALLVAMAAGSLLILAYGESPARVYGTLLSETWGSAYGIGQVLFKATPLIFTGLAVAFAYRTGLLNVGAEGQMAVGAFATAAVAAALPAATPALVAVPLAVLAGAAAGGLLGALPGWLRARFGAHEVITTIMLNFIVTALVLWVGRSGAFVTETTHTGAIAEGATLGSLGLGTSAANTSFFLALIAALWAAWFFARTRTGFEWRVLGQSPSAAEAAGIHVRRAIVLAMAVSGALAGAVGANTVLGDKHYFEEGLGRGAGFMGIAVALLGRSHPLGVVLAALLFGTLSHGGFAVNALVPRELVEVLQAVIILALIATSAALRNRLAAGIVEIAGLVRGGR